MSEHFRIRRTGSYQSVIAQGKNPMTYVQNESAVCWELGRGEDSRI
jgi:hypothetical protein